MIERLGWLGVRTERFAETVALYRDAFGLEPFQEDETSARFRLQDGTELHVYGPADDDHRFFGTRPVVGLRVHDHDQARARLEASGIEFLTSPEDHGSTRWSHFRAPDGNVYELIGGR
jgi:catechol 2,3-dioxygenase-like lactoylglutathione lyase family enzyme